MAMNLRFFAVTKNYTIDTYEKIFIANIRKK